jgi:hypothetical protein
VKHRETHFKFCPQHNFGSNFSHNLDLLLRICLQRFKMIIPKNVSESAVHLRCLLYRSIFTVTTWIWIQAKERKMERRIDWMRAYKLVKRVWKIRCSSLYSRRRKRAGHKARGGKMTDAQSISAWNSECKTRPGRLMLRREDYSTMLAHKNRGYAVAQLVEVLWYKPEGRGFDCRWCD